MIFCHDKNGRLSQLGFLGGLSVLLLYPFMPQTLAGVVLLFFAYSGVLGGFFKLVLSPPKWEVWWRAEFLGLTTGLGLYSLIFETLPYNLGIYIVLLSLFHYSEYLVTAYSNPNNLTTDSYLLNHSKEYGIAVAAGFVEYFIELTIFPSIKHLTNSIAVGFIFCVIGDLVRKSAIMSAGVSFNHVVQDSKKSDHVLITSGPYSVVRHPSYSGWFIWSVSTQILLANPICLIAYTLVTWKFFKARIYYEEYNLINFFGVEYEDYKSKVPSGVPFVYGYRRNI